MSAREDISFLVGSDTRVAILRAVVESSYRPTDLATECSCARETAQRALSAFLDRGWVAKTEGRYRSTPAGELILDEYDELAATVTYATKHSEFFARIDEDAAPPSSVLDDFTFTESAPESPHAPLDRYLTILGDDRVARLRGVTPIVSRIFNDAAREVIGPDTDVELVIDRSVLDASRTEFPDDTRTAAELDEFRLYVTPDPVGFGMVLVDGRAFVGAYDDHGNIVASIDGATDRFVEWAEDLFRTYRTRGDRLDASEYL